LSRLSWYYRRLQSMRPAEIMYRFQQELVRIGERWPVLSSHFWPTPPPGQDIPSYQDHWPAFFFNSDEKDEVQAQFREAFPKELKTAIANAEAIQQGTITLFEKTFHFEAEINWHKDPKTNREWPRIRSNEIDIRDGRTIGGVKWVWELNRHYHIVTLAKSAFLTNNEELATKACQQLVSWIDQNPPGYGVNWTSALEAALRIINWCWAIAFLRPTAAFQQDQFIKLSQSVYQQAAYIFRHFSKYSSANNHLVGEAAGLVFAGFCFPWFDQATLWQKTGLRILQEQLPLQLLPDGVSAEQSINYLIFFLDFNLLAWRLANINHIAPPETLLQRLTQTASFIQTIMRPNGTFPTIGDSDDAHVVRLDESGDAHRLQSVLASILLEIDKQAVLPRKDEKTFWLFGPSSLQNKIKPTPSPPSTLFPNGGYAVLRHESTLMTFDFGPLGYLSTAAHGHADALSITLSVANQPILIDPNTYAYQEGYEWRDYFRSTAAHNTIRVDSLDQSNIQGPFLWGKQAKAKLVKWDSQSMIDRVAASHDGYADLDVTHKRIIHFHKPNKFVVTDCLEGTKQHYIELFWHFAETLSLERDGQKVNLTNPNVAATLIVSKHKDLIIELYNGSTDPILGWTSSSYGHKNPTNVLRYCGYVNLPLTITTNIIIETP
jgi:hypothetical protein